MRKILIVVGTRPNFIKVTQFKSVAETLGGAMEIKIVHTGQHYDNSMSKVFFEQFELVPDYFMNIPASSPNSQIAEIIQGMERICTEYQPDLVLVPGDVNSTLAAAVAANKLNLKLGHIESGLRSFDRTMPEEINRIITDKLSDLLFVTEQSGIDNLTREGIHASKIHFVGNTMIDTLVAFSEQIDKSPIIEEHHLEDGKYLLMTMHRPANVDTKEGLQRLFNLLKLITEHDKLIFPVHPRTLDKMNEFSIGKELAGNKNFITTAPLDYFAFQKLIKNSRCVITDSGGIQEETTYYGIPCLTLRKSTERPSTIDEGTNELVEFDSKPVMEKVAQIKSGQFKAGSVPKLWDGRATERILNVIMR